MTNKFKVGDRVVFVPPFEDPNFPKYHGTLGTVYDPTPDHDGYGGQVRIKVCWDDEKYSEVEPYHLPILDYLELESVYNSPLYKALR